MLEKVHFPPVSGWLADEQRLRQTLSAAEIGTWYACDGMMFWDSVTLKMYGVEAPPATREEYLELIPESQRELIQASIQRSEAEQVPDEFEHSLSEPDGSERWLLVKGVPHLDHNGKVRGRHGVVLEITQRKRAEQGVQESEKRMELVLRGAELGLWDANLLTGETYVSPYYLEMLGYHPQEVTDSNRLWLQSIHPEDRPRVVSLTDHAVADESMVFDEEYRIQVKSGGYRWFRGRGSVVQRTADGKAARFVGTMLDITHRKQSEQQLASSQSLFSTAFDYAFYGMVLSNARGLILRVNESFKTMLGYGEELVGMRIDDLIHPSDLNESQEDREHLKQTPHAGYIRQRKLLTQEGNTLIARVAVNAIRDASGAFEYFIAQIEDLTKTRELENQVIQSEKMSTLGVLTSSLSHELKTPLSGVLMSLPLIQPMLKEGKEEELLDLLGTMQQMVAHSLDTIQSLLSFSRKSDSQDFVQCDLDKLFAELLLLLEPMAKKLGVRLETEVEPALPEVHCNRTQIQQVLLNLGANAMQAMRDGSERVLRFSAYTKDEWLVLDVSDTGPGIEPMNLEKIFDLFYTTKEEGEGTGLGLSISRDIIRRHGGDLTVSNHLNTKGCTFRITLPPDGQSTSMQSP